MLRELWTVVQALRAQVAELEARLGQNSSNSSRPPSSDPPSAPPPPKRAPSGRKPGGQPGHAAHQRVLLPPEQVDAFVAVWPERCRDCGLALPQTPALVTAASVRHQVSEQTPCGAPPVRVVVTAYQLQRVRCPCCGSKPPWRSCPGAIASAGARWSACWPI